MIKVWLVFFNLMLVFKRKNWHTSKNKFNCYILNRLNTYLKYINFKIFDYKSGKLRRLDAPCLVFKLILENHMCVCVCVCVQLSFKAQLRSCSDNLSIILIFFACPWHKRPYPLLLSRFTAAKKKTGRPHGIDG